MPRSNDFTHGGSVGKNLVLLLRALLNIFSFGVFGYGASQFALPTEGFVFGLNELCFYGGAVLCLFCLVVNLFAPFAHRGKGNGK